MPAKLYVCSGCCCGRVEKGNNEVPVDMLKSAWQEHNIGETVQLNITSCLGPCSMNNVSLLKTASRSIWLGKLNTLQHFEDLIDWAKSIPKGEQFPVVPENLATNRFVPSSL